MFGCVVKVYTAEMMSLISRKLNILHAFSNTLPDSHPCIYPRGALNTNICVKPKDQSRFMPFVLTDKRKWTTNTIFGHAGGYVCVSELVPHCSFPTH